jgi:sec-independent protein translocase protein TatC
MMVLAIPLILLYFMAGGIALLVDRRRDRKVRGVQTGVSSIESPTPIGD